jgi:DNA-binding response OmpR family regulator
MSWRPLALVVDDDLDVRDLISRVLSKTGYDVTTAEDGDAALLAAQTRAPDLVTLDLSLPGLHGPDLIHALRGVGDPHIVMVTGRRLSEPDRDLARSAGAHEFLIKPFSLQELRALAEHRLQSLAGPASA